MLYSAYQDKASKLLREKREEANRNEEKHYTQK